MIKSKQTRQKVIGNILKICIILSCTAGIVLHIVNDDSGFMNRIFLAFTIQSNIWIALICMVFLLTGLIIKKHAIPEWLHILKFMFTVSILLTYLVFAVLLTPFMHWSYLISLSNILLHTITAILALADFLLDSYVYATKKRTLVTTGLIMPFLYSIFFFIYYEITNQMPVPYFFLDFKKYGWFNIGQQGISVIYWMAVLCAVLVLTGYVILWLKEKNNNISKRTVIYAAIFMLLISVSFSILNIVI